MLVSYVLLLFSSLSFPRRTKYDVGQQASLPISPLRRAPRDGQRAREGRSALAGRMVVTVVTVIVRPQNSCAVIRRGWTSAVRWHGLHHIAKPIVKCDIAVCGNGGQPGQIFVAARRAKKPRGRENNASQTFADRAPRRADRFALSLSSLRESPIVRSIRRHDRAETESSAATDNNYSSNVLCGLCQREHAPLGQTRHTWGRRKNSQRVKAVRKTVARSIQEPRIRRPLTRSTVRVTGRLALRLTFR